MKLRLHNLEFGTDGCIGVCAVGPQDKVHPNKMPFKGILLLLDVASDKPPHGAEGHRIYVPSAVAKKRLNSLINMGVNYSSELAAHAPQHKVGVITGARIEGNKVLVNGFFWQRDFPKVKRDMQTGRLGMSMELQDVTVRSKDAPVWYLQDFHFSGATILFKSAAAYTQTSLSAGAIQHLGEMWGSRVKQEIRKLARKTVLAAAAADVRQPEGGRMKNKSKERTASSGDGQRLVQAIAAGVGPAISKAVTDSLKPFVNVLNRQQQSISRIAASVEEAKVLSIEAARNREDEDEDEDVEEIEAHADGDEMDAEGDDMDADAEDKKKKGDEDDDSDGDGDEEDDSELDAALEELEDDAADDEPGELNKEAKNKGDKTTRTGKVGKAKHMKELVKASATHSIRASSVIRELYAAHRALRKKYRTMQAKAESRNEKIETLENQLEALSAQVEQYAERTDRRSVSAELGNFLAKNNVDVRELRAEGKKLSVDEVDQIFANAPVELDPTTRMWFKNQLTQAELMDQGEIHRGIN